MDESDVEKPYDQDKIAGTFVETAFTNDEVERAVAEEVRLGVRDATCPFLEGDTGE